MSCVDTIILPDDKTVEEDFWQTKKDVSMMVNGAYSAMANGALQQRLIVWTSRSDELNFNTAISNSSLNQIYTANIQTTNAYCNWGNLYSVINNCNLVLDKSAEVMDIDPNYLEGDHNNNVAQMKALRALAYFYLVRVFRDVPLVLEPYKNSSQEMNIPQVAPSIVIDQIIADLEEVKDMPLSTQSVSDWKKNGYITRDGAYAILADAYLWKASVLGDEASYDRCIECCNVIRNNRSSAIAGFHFGPKTDGLDDDGFNLNTYRNIYNVFERNGDSESILEIVNNNNTSLCNAYYKNEDKATAQPLFYTNDVYGKVTVDDGHVFNQAGSASDMRGFESIYQFNGSAEDGFHVRKFVAMQGRNGNNSAEVQGDRTYKDYQQSWNVYRATDIMLMKAEALVQKGALSLKKSEDLYNSLSSATSESERLNLANQLRDANASVAANNVTAARQVQIVSTRARIDEVSDVDSTKYVLNVSEYDGTDLDTYVRTQLNNYTSLISTADELEILVMNERARELCFEGKRWFDMLRYNYRHVTGVDYSTILADMGGKYVRNYQEMLKLIARKYTSGGGNGVIAKMPTEPYLYMPIIQAEMDVNPLLKQNPVYSDGSSTEKNY